MTDNNQPTSITTREHYTINGTIVRLRTKEADDAIVCVIGSGLNSYEENKATELEKTFERLVAEKRQLREEATGLEIQVKALREAIQTTLKGGLNPNEVIEILTSALRE